MAQFVSLNNNATLPRDRNVVIISCGGANRQINIPLPDQPTSSAWDGVDWYVGNNDTSHSLDVYSANSESLGTLGPNTGMRVIFRTSDQRWYRA